MARLEGGQDRLRGDIAKTRSRQGAAIARVAMRQAPEEDREEKSGEEVMEEEGGRGGEKALGGAAGYMACGGGG